jgi:hypothetical protein
LRIEWWASFLGVWISISFVSVVSPETLETYSSSCWSRPESGSEKEGRGYTVLKAETCDPSKGLLPLPLTGCPEWVEGRVEADILYSDAEEGECDEAKDDHEPTPPSGPLPHVTQSDLRLPTDPEPCSTSAGLSLKRKRRSWRLE